ncbi:MAG: ComEC/Rec2 family competence protein [Candidatus Parcubacteria bacterium]|nr:ComEC/Rec2 family competence protein [Candidatus Parcubacteria bacterium]
MNQAKIFFSSCLFFILGVFICSALEFGFFISFLILLLSLTFLILSLKNKYFLVLGLWGIFLLLGIWRYQLSLPKQSPDQIYFYNGREVQVRGFIDKEPDQREDKVKLEIKSQQIFLNNSWQKVKGKILVTNYLYPEYNYGDKLELICNLLTPEKVQGFAYDDYLARYNVYSTCYNPKITLLEKNQGNFVLAKILKIKNFFIARINYVLAEPQSSFLAGLLIGAKRAIPADLQNNFSKTGTTHIVAVSGYNVTIIAVFLMLIFQNLGLGRKKSFWVIIGFLIFFAVMTGLQSSCIRAAIMGGVVLLANYLGRTSKIKNVLVLTVILMLIANPKILVFDLGFQLSFLATLGLVYLNPILTRLLRTENIKHTFLKVILGDYLLTTVSAIIMTQPIILYNYGKISLVAPLANILILPFVPLAMLLGFMTGILAMIWTGLGWVAGWSVWLVLTYIIWILEKLAGLNWAYYEFPQISIWLMALLYVLIISFIYKFKKVRI